MSTTSHLGSINLYHRPKRRQIDMACMGAWAHIYDPRLAQCRATFRLLKTTNLVTCELTSAQSTETYRATALIVREGISRWFSALSMTSKKTAVNNATIPPQENCFTALPMGTKRNSRDSTINLSKSFKTATQCRPFKSDRPSKP